MTELGNKGPGAVEGRIFKNRGFDTSKQGYDTSLGFYGGKITKDEEGKTVFDMRGNKDILDKYGDKRVRSIDEHSANAGLFLKHAGKVWKNRAASILEAVHLKSSSRAEMDPEARQKWDEKESVQKIAPRSFLKLAAEGIKGNRAARYRGKPEEIAENAERLGLTDYYGIHPWGVEIKKPEIYTDGISLYDIVVAKKEGKEQLQDIDKNQALAEAAKYTRQMHDAHGGIGELLIMDFQFQTRDGSTVSNPVLGLPDIVWNKDATLSDTSKKATDILDFMVNLSYWEHKAETDPTKIQNELDVFLHNYGDERVIKAVRSFINPDRKSKKPTLAGESKLAMVHNVARLGSDTKYTSNVRQDVFDATIRYLHPLQTA